MGEISVTEISVSGNSVRDMSVNMMRLSEISPGEVR